VRTIKRHRRFVLAQHHVPRLEALARRCLRNIFDLGLDEVFERAKNIDHIFAPILLDAPLEEANRAVSWRLARSLSNRFRWSSEIVRDAHSRSVVELHLVRSKQDR
jgi:hypothetical protein